MISNPDQVTRNKTRNVFEDTPVPCCPTEQYEFVLLRACKKKLPPELMSRPVQYYCGLCQVPQTASRTLLPCQTCLVMHYCSREHRREHRSRHKRRCARLGQQRRRILFNEVRVVGKLKGDDEQQLSDSDYSQTDDEFDNDDDSDADEDHDDDVDNTRGYSTWTLRSSMVLEQFATNPAMKHYERVSFLNHFKGYLYYLYEMSTRASVTLALQLASGLLWIAGDENSAIDGLPAFIDISYLYLDDLQGFHNFQHWYRPGLRPGTYMPEDMAPVNVLDVPSFGRDIDWLNLSLRARVVFLARVYLILESAKVVYTARSILPQEIMAGIANQYLRSTALYFEECHSMDLEWVDAKLQALYAQLWQVKEQLKESSPMSDEWLRHLKILFGRNQDRRVLELIRLAKQSRSRPIQT